MINLPIKRIIFLLIVACSFWYMLTHRPSKALKTQAPTIQENVANKAWAHACIDTMKTSRDNARRWADREDLQEIIQKEMIAIKGTGANCVAIATPYDKEFIPFLTLWVQEARKQDLTIWFRGNFSKWENWFEYEGTMSSEELFESGTEFIKDNKRLFKDGDIFTLAPEAENGGPFEQVEIDEHKAFRAFLIEQYKICQAAFKDIDTDVTCNWFSMNGGLAKRSLDQSTIDAIGGVVTIDHYIKTPQEMGEFIDYFYDNFGAKVVIGEYGAPIPEINGEMTQDEQAVFIDSLLKEIYERKEKVDGHSYWVLYDGSTRLLNYDYTPRKGLAVLKEYFTGTALIEGKVTNTIKNTVADVSIYNNKEIKVAKTNENGEFKFSVYPHEDTFTFRKDGFFSTVINVNPKAKTITTYNIKLNPTKLTPLHRFKEWITL